MSPTFPFELIIRILELAPSPSSAVSAYKEDRQLLSRCCLVSRQLRAVAQPLLWHILTSKKGDVSPLVAFPHLATHVRVLELQELGAEGDKAFELVEKLPELEEVRIERGGNLTDSQARSLSKLKHLFLFQTDLDGLCSVVFPNLVSLVPRPDRGDRIGSAPLLPGACFPSLRAVYVRGKHYNPATQRLQLVEPISLRPGQLDMIQVHAADWTVFPFDLLHRGTPVLLTFGCANVPVLSQPALADFEHYQIEPVSSHNSRGYSHPLSYLDDPCRPLRDLCDVVKRSQALKSLWLPWDFSDLNPKISDVLHARDALLEACRAKGVEVRWRLASRETEDDRGVSREFWEYARELKRRKRVEAMKGRSE